MTSIAIEIIHHRYQKRQDARLALKIAGYSQSELARLAEVDQPTVSRYFNGIINSAKLDETVSKLLSELEQTAEVN